MDHYQILPKTANPNGFDKMMLPHFSCQLIDGDQNLTTLNHNVIVIVACHVIGVIEWVRILKKNWKKILGFVFKTYFWTNAVFLISQPKANDHL